MSRYKFVVNSTLIREILDNGSERFIPDDPENLDYQAYLKWAENHTTETADPAPTPSAQDVADGADRDAFLSAVDSAITAVNNNGWDGLTANNRKQIMLNLLKAVKVAAKRL